MAIRVRLTADVDPEVKKRVKVAAVESETTVSEWVEQALRERLLQFERVETTESGRRYIAPGLSLPPEAEEPRVDSTSREELLKAIIADRDGWRMPSPGSKPMGSKNPVKLRGGKSMAETVIEEREERDRLLAGEAIDDNVGRVPGWYREGMAIAPEPGARPKGSENPPKLRDGGLISDAVIEDRR